jgi:hypothetical protein
MRKIKMPEQQPHEFWKIDLSKLTWSGWLLIIVTIGTLLGVLIGMMALFEALGVHHDPVNNRNNRWMAVLAFIPAIGAACGVFVVGRKMFDRLGCPILSTERKRR